jgi:DNA-binding MarR family transcriptional regulator
MPAMSATDERLEAALMLVLDRMREMFHARMREEDLSPPQTFTLQMLHQPQSMRSLANAQGCDASNMTGIADRLEERGLVERRTDPHDRRVKLLTVTDEGRAVLARLRRSMLDALPGAPGLGPHERRELAGLLERLTGGEPQS